MAKTESLAALPAWPDFVVDYITDDDALARFASQAVAADERIVMVARAATSYKDRSRAILQPIPRRTADLLGHPDNLAVMRKALSDVLRGSIEALDARD